MNKICTHCGALLPEEAVFCSACGTPCNAVPAPKSKKGKWWMIAAPIFALVLIAAVVAGLMWNTIYLHINPMAVLSKSFANTSEALATREDGTLLLMLAQAVDADGNFISEIGLDMNYENIYASFDLDLDLVGNVDRKNKQMSMTLNGGMDFMGYSYPLDMEAYLNTDVAAVNWKQITGSDYYGIVYDSFSDDIRSNAILSELFDPDTIDELQEIFDLFSDTLDTSGAEETEFSSEYAQTVLAFLNDHDTVVGKDSLILSTGTQKCNTITYTVTNQELHDLMEDLVKILEDDDSLMNVLFPEYQYAAYGYDPIEMWEEMLDVIYEDVDTLEDTEGTSVLTFYLHKNQLVFVDYTYEGEDEEAQIQVMLNANPGVDDIEINWYMESDDAEGALEITLSKEMDGDAVSESISIVLTEDGDSLMDCVLSYEWDLGDEELSFCIEGDFDDESVDFQMDMAFYEKDGGLVLELPELVGLLTDIAPDMAYQLEGFTVYMTIAFYPGAEVEEPNFINFRNLTEDDLNEMESNLYAYYN